MSRSELEHVARLAREYIQKRASGIPWPEVVAAREALREALNEPAPEPPLFKPWHA